MKLPFILVYLLFAMSTNLCAQLSGDIVHVHDPCVVKHGEHYYLYSTGEGVPIRRSVDMKQWRVIGTFKPQPADS